MSAHAAKRTMDGGDTSTRLSHLLEAAAASSVGAGGHQRARTAFSDGGGDDSADSGDSDSGDSDSGDSDSGDSDSGSAHSRELNRPPVLLIPKRSYSSSEEEEEEEEEEDDEEGSYESHHSVDEAEYDDNSRQRGGSRRSSDVAVTEILVSADEDGEVGEERDAQYSEGGGAIAREGGADPFVDTSAGVMRYNSVASPAGAAPAPRTGYTGLTVADLMYAPVESQSPVATNSYTSTPSTEVAFADQATAVSEKDSPSGKANTPHKKASTSPPSSAKQKAKRKAKTPRAPPFISVDALPLSIASLKKLAEDVSAVVCMHVRCICVMVAFSRYRYVLCCCCVCCSTVWIQQSWTAGVCVLTGNSPMQTRRSIKTCEKPSARTSTRFAAASPARIFTIWRFFDESSQRTSSRCKTVRSQCCPWAKCSQNRCFTARRNCFR